MKQRPQYGFNLIELLITLVIISILAAFAYPEYRSHVLRSRHSDAIAAITKAAQLQERWFTQNGTYTNDIEKLGAIKSPEGDYLSPDGYYLLAVTVPDEASCKSGGKFYCYDLTATPTTKNAQNKDSECTNFKLDQTGAKSVTGSGDVDSCW
jgi:type IV pilus assembly protein PilE